MCLDVYMLSTLNKKVFNFVTFLNCWVILDVLVENFFQQPNTFFPVHGHSFINSLVVIWPIKKWPWTCCGCDILCLCCSSVFDISWSVQVNGFPSLDPDLLFVVKFSRQCKKLYSASCQFKLQTNELLSEPTM